MTSYTECKTFFDLFAGIGGFHLGLKKKLKCVGACEIDKYARQVYSEHFPGIRIWEDATKIKPEELPDFDVLTYRERLGWYIVKG